MHKNNIKAFILIIILIIIILLILTFYENFHNWNKKWIKNYIVIRISNFFFFHIFQAYSVLILIPLDISKLLFRSIFCTCIIFFIYFFDIYLNKSLHLSVIFTTIWTLDRRHFRLSGFDKCNGNLKRRCVIYIKERLGKIPIIFYNPKVSNRHKNRRLSDLTDTHT